MRRALTCLAVLAVAIWLLPTPASGSERFVGRELPQGVEQLKLSSPLQTTVPPSSLMSLPDQVEGGRFIIRLKAPSVAGQRARGKSAQHAKRQIEFQQQDLSTRIFALDPSARVIARTQLVLNAIFVEVDEAILPKLAQDPAVLSIKPVGRYEMDLSDTVPYIGATAVHTAGYDGSGVRVAVLDSGIDYYHANLGGDGNPADYAADDPTIIEPGTFPTARVVGGYDFVGSVWPFAAETPDPDPLDDGPAAGHGTHVGDIIGGTSGVAPGVDLYAVKVCSSVSTSCSGIALIQGMEFAVDPDGDGDPADHVDVINMSLGSDYGQPFDDDLSAAVNSASAFGVLTVSSAGNGADKPYVTGTASSAMTALSVAQTEVPSAFVALLEATAPPAIEGFYVAAWQDWSAELQAPIEAPLLYGDGADGNLDGCVPFTAGSLVGHIVLVDRGNCFFSDKIFNIDAGGGLVGIIGLVAPGAPFAGACGLGCPPGPGIPGYMISQADSNALKDGLPDTMVSFDPAVEIDLAGSMVDSSSRGPQHENTTLIKPEIGAPGASVSAVAGTGIGESPFGGTSGASPMVAGSAALLLQAEPSLMPHEAKARLMNTAETEIYNDFYNAAGPGLAPITRIGGGEVRVDDAVNTPAAAWDDDNMTGALSFGFIDVEKETVNLHKKVRVRNYSTEDIEYTVTPTFRYADDEAMGAVSLQAPDSIMVQAGGDTTFTVKLTLKGAMLMGNFMNSGSMGANPEGLTANEFDGYLMLENGDHSLHLPWHVLPRRAANVVGRSVLNLKGGLDTISLTNNGVGAAQNDAYSLLATSRNMPEGGNGEQAPTPDIRAVGINTFPVPAGFCSGQVSFIWAFAVNTWERQEHLLPVTHQVWLDTNQDGTDDYVVLNRDLSGFGTIGDGRQVAWALNLVTGSASAFFFAEHSMNTGNTVLLICGEQIGLTGTDMLATNVDMEVYAQDFYYGGPGDLVDGLTVTPLGEQYFGLPGGDIGGKSVGSMQVFDFGPFPGNSPELGVMLFSNGDRGDGYRGGATEVTETLFFGIDRPPIKGKKSRSGR